MARLEIEGGGPFTGIGVFFEGAGLLRRQRSLWGLALVPIALSLIAVSAAVALVYANADPIHALVTGWTPTLEVTAWYQWLWLGPARLLLFLLGWLLFALVGAVSVLLAFVLANVLSAPFLDALSRRVEQIVLGHVRESAESGWRALVSEGRRAIVGELQRATFFTSVWLVLLALAVLVPGGQIVTGPALVAFSVLFLPLDYASYTLDRRAVPFSVRRRWVLGNWGTMAGFGGAGFLSCLVPGLNFLLIPVFVTGGTLLALRHPPPVDEPAGG